MKKIGMYIHWAGASGGGGGAEDMVIDQIRYANRTTPETLTNFTFFTEESSGWSVTLDEINSLGVKIVRTSGSVEAFQQAYKDEGIQLLHLYSCGDVQPGYQAAIDLNLPVVESAACVAYSRGWEIGYRNLNVVYLCKAHWLGGSGGRDYFKWIDGGVDLVRLSTAGRQSCRNNWGLDDRPVVGWFGRFDQFKCPMSFPTIAKMISEKVDAQFIMFGDGADKGRTQWLADQAKVKIIFPGFTRTKGLAFGAMDVYVFPSWQEAFGRVMVEAMGCSVPIVTADYPVMRELCEDAALYVENGRTDPLPESICRQYADATIKILSDSELSSRMSLRGFERSRHYDAARMTEEYAALYLEMLK